MSRPFYAVWYCPTALGERDRRDVCYQQPVRVVIPSSAFVVRFDDGKAVMLETPACPGCREPMRNALLAPLH